MSNRSYEKRFWARVNTNGPTVRAELGPCWVWTGGTDGNYGTLCLRGSSVKAHRLSWEIHFGAIPDGLWVLHRCDNPPCVNPAHLFLGTRSDNMLDAGQKGRIRTVGHALLTHCKRGHEFTRENTYIRPNGHRNCRRCMLVYRPKTTSIKRPKLRPSDVRESVAERIRRDS